MSERILHRRSIRFVPVGIAASPIIGMSDPFAWACAFLAGLAVFVAGFAQVMSS